MPPKYEDYFEYLKDHLKRRWYIYAFIFVGSLVILYFWNSMLPVPYPLWGFLILSVSLTVMAFMIISDIPLLIARSRGKRIIKPKPSFFARPLKEYIIAIGIISLIIITLLVLKWFDALPPIIIFLIVVVYGFIRYRKSSS